MRLLLQLLLLIAMLVAPLAAATASPQPNAATCEQMDMGTAKHQMPAGHHDSSAACCVAVPAAIDAPIAALVATPPLDHPTFVVMTLAFHLSAGSPVEDPPPRPA